MNIFDTSTTKAEAMKKAKKVLAKMKTAGWKISANKNENRDVTIWHYRLINGGLSVSPYRSNGKLTYIVMLDIPSGSEYSNQPHYFIPTDHNKVFSTVSATCIDPNKAVECVVSHTRKAFVNYVETMEAAEAVLKTTRRKPARRKK